MYLKKFCLIIRTLNDIIGNKTGKGKVEKNVQ